ncbi:SH3 domain [Emericellopsis cladophorae]|uniref:SH3 domain n=1 Tax=Emericellopsis cladophorae TaxID=2686198 RepID=A0A9Q0BFG3_9HYPO|nr:SH3 domain [Emericellopsis cladophorae]KAI6783442.1 SH3 domain [Emericellopsis cladophorae]
MPVSHRHTHPRRELMDVVGDIIDGANVAPGAIPVQGEKRDADAQQDEAGASVPTVIDAPTKTANIATATEIAKATGHATKPGDEIIGKVTATATEPLSVPTQSSSSKNSDEQVEEGMTAGAKAGIAFGILGGVLLIAGLVYFIGSRRKNGQQNNEKFAPAGLAPPPPMKDSVKRSSKSPRLSLRPVTHFFPGFGDKHTSKGPFGGYSMSTAGASGPGNRSPGPSPFDRPGTSHSTHPANPFGNQAERAASSVTDEHSMYARSTPPTPDRSAKPLPSIGRQQSMRADRARNLDLTLPESRGPPSPAGTEFSMSSIAPGTGSAAPSSGAAAIAAAGGPQNTHVYRVQLDFQPSLEDEMELRAGELVRLLHEYDDGWALCIKLDRSRQGVVPRTCLSTRPVKPRPPQGGARGPPVNPNGRPASPAHSMNGPGPSASPAGFRSQSPAGGRSQSPAGRPRAPSKSHGPSPMNPNARPNRPASPGSVFGQAM